LTEVAWFLVSCGADTPPTTARAGFGSSPLAADLTLPVGVVLGVSCGVGAAGLEVDGLVDARSAGLLLVACAAELDGLEERRRRVDGALELVVEQLRLAVWS